MGENNMKKTVLLVTILICLAALTACGGNKTTPASGSAREAATPGETVTPTGKATPVVTVTPEATPSPTPTPTLTPTPLPTGEPVPAGFSDRELEERAKAEYESCTYAYRSEKTIKGNEMDFYDTEWNPDEAVRYDKEVCFWDAEGNIRLTRYYLNNQELGAIAEGHFGRLKLVNGKQIWNGSFLDYAETDEQGRKTAELSGKNNTKLFYEYDDAGHLKRQREYTGDKLNSETVYTYDGEGELAVKEERSYQTFEGENTLTSSSRYTLEGGKTVLRDNVYAEDEEWYVNLEKVDSDMHTTSDSKYVPVGKSAKTEYTYNTAGDLALERTLNEKGEEVIKKEYAYTSDEAGRITGVTIDTEVLTQYKEKLHYEFKYYNNGPVLMVQKCFAADGQTAVYCGNAKIFLPDAKLNAMLKTGSGFSYDEFHRKLGMSIRFPEGIPSLSDVNSPSYLMKAFSAEEGEGRFLYDLYLWNSKEETDSLLPKLLERETLPMNKVADVPRGSYVLYDGNRMTEYYSTDGGSAYRRVMKYDAAGRLKNIDVTGYDNDHYEFSYNGAGRLVKSVYKSTSSFGNYGGTITYSYDASGKLTVINGDYDYDDEGYDEPKKYQVYFRLKAYNGNGRD